MSVGTDPLTANTYSYVNGDPINLVDPTGHYPSCGSAACDLPPVSKNLQPQLEDQWQKMSAKAKKDWDRAQDPRNKKARVDKQVARLTEQANAQFNWRREIVNLFGEVSGINDLVRCVTKGNAGACFATFAGLAGAAFWKAGKFVKGGYKLMRAFDKFKDARNAARSQLGELKALQKKLGDQVAAFKTSRKSTKSKGSGDFCPVGGPKSFSGKTLVLMADGTRKPIAKIKVGDGVMATDPATGVTAPQVVTHVWVHTDDLTNLDLANGDVLTTTEDHPFWNATDVQWQEIADFDRGDVVVTDDWLPIEVTGLDPGSTIGIWRTTSPSPTPTRTTSGKATSSSTTRAAPASPPTTRASQKTSVPQAQSPDPTTHFAMLQLVGSPQIRQEFSRRVRRQCMGMPEVAMR